MKRYGEFYVDIRSNAIEVKMSAFAHKRTLAQRRCLRPPRTISIIRLNDRLLETALTAGDLLRKRADMRERAAAFLPDGLDGLGNRHQVYGPAPAAGDAQVQAVLLQITQRFLT